MVAVKLEHSNLVQHQASILKQLQAFRKEGQLCDVVLISCDGTPHWAHKAVLCAASEEIRNMLGPIQHGQPVRMGPMGVSDGAVSALLHYIYGEEPEVELQDALELLNLEDANIFPWLEAAIEDGLCAVLDSAPVKMALKILQRTQDLHKLKAACEEKVARNFESCIGLADFLDLSPGQLGRVVQRDDLKVSEEKVVVKGIFNWLNNAKDQGICLESLLVSDLQWPSSRYFSRLQLHFLSKTMGCQEVRRAFRRAFRANRCNAAPDPPKRRCLQMPDQAASRQKVLPHVNSMCWHDGAIYCATHDHPNPSRIFRWKPGDSESQVVAGNGAPVNGVNDLGSACTVSVCPNGEILVADRSRKCRLLSFRNGSGSQVLKGVPVWSVFCAPSGHVYLLTKTGLEVEKLVGAKLQSMISSNNLPAEGQLNAYADLFVTKDEEIYLSDTAHGRVLRFKAGEAKPEVVGEAPNHRSSNLRGLFVTEEKIYVADAGQKKVWAFHPGAAWTEVLTCPGAPLEVLVQGTSLYVSMDGEGDAKGVFEYSLLELQR